MKTRPPILILICLYYFTTEQSLKCQNKVWTVDECIQYATEKNIQVQKALVSNDINEAELNFAKSAWYPSLSSSVRENYSWNNQTNSINGSTVFKGVNGINLSVSSGVTVYNGNKIRNSLKKSKTDYEASKYYTEVIKETISLSVMNAYLQVLYSEEQVKNSLGEIASTMEQLNLAGERYRLGVIANSDFLQVRSQLATEKQTLALSQSQLDINRITLMQLMEIPETNEFKIEHPDLESIIDQNLSPDPKNIYQISLGIKPEVIDAELNKRSSQIGVNLAKAGYFPNITISTGVSSLYSSSQKESSFAYQIINHVSPAIGLSASIPIYMNKQVRTDVEIAKKNTDIAELDELNIKNQLRKDIEQACQDVASSQIEYESSNEAFKAVKESFDVASEKYFQGLMNSVDFLIQKTGLILAESAFLQSKYRLIFSYKVLDFYIGKPLSLSNRKE